MSIKKFKQYNEAYTVNNDEYDDFGEEHAKEIISYYIENKLDGFTLEDSYDRLALEQDPNIQEGIKDALEKFVVDMLGDIKEFGE
jgi:hypothetical protein